MERVVVSNLRHLRAFQMVAKFQNVRKAAEAVCLTQPAVTQAIAKLEHQIGVSLFERRSSGTYPTPAGEIFASRISGMFAQIEDALAEAGAVNTPNRSRASVADRITHSQIRALSAIAAVDLEDVRECSVISKASLHRAVRDLERSTDLMLLRQGADGASATDVGRILARRIKLALSEVELAINEIASEVREQGDRLRVGAMPLTGSLIVAPILNDLMRLFPHAHIEVQTAGRKALTDALRRGQIDIFVGLLCEPPDADSLVREPLVSLPYVVVARPDHPLALKSDVMISDFDDYSWVVPNQNTVRRAAFDQFSHALSSPPKVDVQASSTSTISLLVAGSDRLGLLTRLEFENEKRAGGIVAIPFGPIEPSHWLGITRRADWSPTAVQKTFIDLVHRKAARIAKAARPQAKIVAA
ncbi:MULTISPECIES: LysR family transcriptional regulator [unclassified Sinorhizobium]|uniref:LysR family transcriptional regulator n=1 Tax=unclassified Sinorhizobium TaxID=2613772 RepID=UPI003523F42A